MRTAIPGNNLPRDVVWSLSVEIFKMWLDRLLDKLILALFLMEGWTRLAIRGHLQPWLWILWTALHSLLEGISHLPVMMERVQGEPSLQRWSQMISTKAILCKSNVKLSVHAHFRLLFSFAVAGHYPLGAMRDRCWEGGAKHPIKCLDLTSKLHFPLDSPTFIPSPDTPF